jgi:hypothetical protein
VVAEVAEFHYGNASRLIVHPAGEVSAGQLWMTRGPWSWRVWSVGEDGRIATSEAGQFQY